MLNAFPESCSFPFSLEALHQFLRGQRPGADELERHEPVQRGLPHRIDRAQSALRYPLDQFVVAEVTNRAQRGVGNAERGARRRLS